MCRKFLIPCVLGFIIITINALHETKIKMEENTRLCELECIRKMHYGI